MEQLDHVDRRLHVVGGTGILVRKELKCPECGVWTVVNEARPSDMYGYRRRRECANGHRFTTQEVVIPDDQIKAEQKLRLQQNRRKK